MKLLVTGGSGGIGAYVVAELAQAGHAVRSFDRALPREQVPGVSYRIGDHEDLGQLVELSALLVARFRGAVIFRSGTSSSFVCRFCALRAQKPGALWAYR